MRKKSIRTTTLLVTIPTVVIAMVVLSVFSYIYAKRIILRSTDREMELCLQEAVESIEKSLAKNRVVVETMARAVEAADPVKEQVQLGELLTSFVASNEETFGGGIWFEPYSYQKDLQYYSPYCMRENGQVVFVDNYSLGEGVYYNQQDWYTNVTNTSKTSVWSAPYFDDYVKISMVTSSAPFYHPDGKLMGVATTDIDLTQLQQMVASLKAHEQGRAFLIDSSGTYIADKDSEKLLRQNILKEGNASLAELGRMALAQGSGTGSYTENGETVRAWYTVVPESGWTIMTVISENALMAEANTLGASLSVVCLVFTALTILLLINFVNRGIIRPVQRLSAAAGRIAQGDLDVQIDVHHQNEIGTVAESMEQMVLRLKKYIDYINEVSGVLNQIADGNLDFELAHDYVGEFSRLKEAMLYIRRTLNGTLVQIVDAAQLVADSSGEISGAAQTLSQGSVKQAASTEEISRRVEEISCLIHENSQTLEQIGVQSGEAMGQIQSGNGKIQQMTSAMNEISESSDQIQKIVKTVEDIAFQTNILALNAAVEAARAGAAGKGFAVVADEVRNLANKSGEAAKTTTALIEGSRRAVEKGALTASEAAKTMETAAASVGGMVQTIQEIAGKSDSQIEAIQTIDEEVKNVSEIVGMNSAMSQESAAKSQELYAQSKQLKVIVSRFRLSENTINSPAEGLL